MASHGKARSPISLRWIFSLWRLQFSWRVGWLCASSRLAFFRCSSASMHVSARVRRAGDFFARAKKSPRNTIRAKHAHGRSFTKVLQEGCRFCLPLGRTGLIFLRAGCACCWSHCIAAADATMRAAAEHRQVAAHFSGSCPKSAMPRACSLRLLSLARSRESNPGSSGARKLCLGSGWLACKANEILVSGTPNVVLFKNDLGARQCPPPPSTAFKPAIRPLAAA